MKRIIFSAPIINKGALISEEHFLLAPPVYAVNVAKLSKSLGQLNQVLIMRSRADSQNYGSYRIDNFGPDYVDELGEIILTGGDQLLFDYMAKNESSKLDPLLIKNKSWVLDGSGRFKQASQNATLEINPCMLAILCHEDAMAEKLFNEELLNTKLLGFNLFEVLLIIDSNLIQKFIDTHTNEMFCVLCMIMQDKIKQLGSMELTHHYASPFCGEIDYLSPQNLLIKMMSKVRLDTLNTGYRILIKEYSAVKNILLDPKLWWGFYKAGVSADQIVNEQNETLLFFACRNTDRSLFLFLLDHGANVNHKNSLGKVALDYLDLESLASADYKFFNQILDKLLSQRFTLVSDYFFQRGSTILCVLLNNGRFADVITLYRKFPYLLEIKDTDENYLSRILLANSHKIWLDQFSVYAKLQPLVKDFLILVKHQHPRLLLQVVLNNKQKLDEIRLLTEERAFFRKKLISELFSENSALIHFAHANNCQDLLPPPSQFTTLYNTLITNVSSFFSSSAVKQQTIVPIANMDSEKESPLLVARAVSGTVDLEEAKGCPTATVVEAPASKISSKASRKPVPVASNMVAYLPVAPTTPVEQTKQKSVEKLMIMQ